MAIRHSKALLLVTLGVVLFSFQAPHPCQFLFGRWQVYKTINLATDDTASFPLDEEGALEAYWASDEHKLVASVADSLVSYIMGKEFKFAKDYMIINETKYKDPLYELTKEDPITFLYANYRIGEIEKLGIKEEVDSTIDVITLSLYKNEEEKKKKDLMDVKSDFVQIPFPGYDVATFYVYRLIMYKGEIIMHFSLCKTEDRYHNFSWLRYLCLRKIA